MKGHLNVRSSSYLLLKQWARESGLVLLLLFPATSPAGSTFQGELIPFPSASYHFYDKGSPDVQQKASGAEVDFFYSAKFSDYWRLLSEIVISDEEHEVERLEVGKVVPEDYQIWLGRYHTALGHWNHKYHHGAYLQTSIHRPSIIEWEDDNGVIPAHATGLSLGVEHEFSNRIVNGVLETGLGPELGNDGRLIPFDMFNNSDGQHNVAVTAMLSSYTKDEPFDDSGIFAGYIEMPSTAANIQEVQQTVVGAFTNYTMGPLLWQGSIYYVSDYLDLNGGDDKKSSFGYWYIEPEYTYSNRWTFYGRWETSINSDNDLYIAQIPGFISDRTFVGARYQLHGNQALKFEIANLKQYGERFNSIEIQWSAALP